MHARRHARMAACISTCLSEAPPTAPILPQIRNKLPLPSLDLEVRTVPEDGPSPGSSSSRGGPFSSSPAARHPNFNIVFFALGFTLPCCTAQLVAALFTRIFDLDYAGVEGFRVFFATYDTSPAVSTLPDVPVHCVVVTLAHSCANVHLHVSCTQDCCVHGMLTAGLCHQIPFSLWILASHSCCFQSSLHFPRDCPKLTRHGLLHIALVPRSPTTAQLAPGTLATARGVCSPCCPPSSLPALAQRS